MSFSFALLALLLGFKHSYDADHLIAVSNILRKVESIKTSIRIGLIWALGHMMTATIITVIVYYFKESILSIILAHFEKVVGLMLIILGILSMRELFSYHFHKHNHGNASHFHTHMHAKSYSHLKGEENNHFHKHMFGIGLIQGLASNDEILILLTASLGITTIGGVLMHISIFSMGVVIGMVAFSFAFSYPLLRLHSNKIQNLISFLTGTSGVIYGIIMLIS